jgi:hypothetical protein
VLVVRTTHLKAGWIRRNGLPLSDRATMTERFFRHDDLLTDSSSYPTATWIRIRAGPWLKFNEARTHLAPSR